MPCQRLTFRFRSLEPEGYVAIGVNFWKLLIRDIRRRWHRSGCGRRGGGRADPRCHKFRTAELAGPAGEREALVRYFAGIFDTHLVVLKLPPFGKSNRVALKLFIDELHLALLVPHLRRCGGLQFSVRHLEVELVFLTPPGRVEFPLPLTGGVVRAGWRKCTEAGQCRGQEKQPFLFGGHISGQFHLAWMNLGGTPR